MSDWIAALAAHAAAGRPCVLVTVLRAEGSTPRDAGAKLVVTADGLAGSVGGGHLELAALAHARALLAQAEAGSPPAGPTTRDFPLGPSLGQCCGGHTTLLFEAILPPRWRIALFGAGHVGKAVARLLADLPCAVEWIDPREAEFPPELPRNARRVVVDAPEAEVAGLPPAADVVVMTHSHALDQDVVEAALRRDDLGFVGLIGSRTKRARFEQRLAARGLTAERLARLTCPIGLPGVGGKLPAEIAIAVVAQLLALRSSSLSPCGAGAPASSLSPRGAGGEGRGEGGPR